MMKFLTACFTWFWHHKRISFGILILLTLGFIFYPRPKPPVATQKVVAGEFIQSISVSGDVVAKNTVDLTFPISGKLVWVGVKKGDSVKAGQAIASIDQQTAQKNLQAALISYSLQRNTFDQSQSDNQNRTPDQALNDAMKRILQDNQYNLDQAVNSVELQNVAKQNAVLVSPISGIITRADTEIAGTDALAGTTTFTVTDPTSVAFDMDVDQADIGNVSNAMPVSIVFDAYPNTTITEPVTGIDFVSHTTSNGGNAFTVETNLPQNTNYHYRVGMNGNAEIITKKKEDVLSVPLSSIADNAYVYVKHGTIFTKTKLQLGLQNDTDAEVIHGLTPGEDIALDPTLAATQTK